MPLRFRASVMLLACRFFIIFFQLFATVALLIDYFRRLPLLCRFAFSSCYSAADSDCRHERLLMPRCYFIRRR